MYTHTNTYTYIDYTCHMLSGMQSDCDPPARRELRPSSNNNSYSINSSNDSCSTITTINRIATITTINRIAIITTTNRRAEAEATVPRARGTCRAIVIIASL